MPSLQRSLNSLCVQTGRDRDSGQLPGLMAALPFLLYTYSCTYLSFLDSFHSTLLNSLFFQLDVTFTRPLSRSPKLDFGLGGSLRHSLTALQFRTGLCRTFFLPSGRSLWTRVRFSGTWYTSGNLVGSALDGISLPVRTSTSNFQKLDFINSSLWTDWTVWTGLLPASLSSSLNGRFVLLLDFRSLLT